MIVVTPPRPLSPEDDRARFDCGREALNGWFRRHALANQIEGISRVSVITDAASGRVVGYDALSATQIERSFLPKAQQRNRPDPVPATLLGQLAIDRAYQGQGLASDLLLYALRAALLASRIIGSMGVVAHPLNDGVRGFYRKWGFEDLPFDPRRAMMIRMSEIERDLGGAAL